jgi:hypothetical protein
MIKINTNLISVFILLLTIFISCLNENKPLLTFDVDGWKNDKWGCSGNRLKLANELKKAKEELKGLNQREIANLLGQPDQRELYKRNQVFYTYFMAGSDKCSNTSQAKKTFIVRFNSLNQANEFIFEK